MPGSEQEVKTLKEVIPKIERNRKHLFEVIEQNEKAHNDRIESLIAEYKKKFEQRKVEALNNRESAKDQLAIEREKNPFAKSRLQLKGDGRAIDFEEKQSQTELDEREKSIRYSLGLRDKAANIQNLQGKAKEEAQAKLARENPEYKFLLESLQGIGELRGINKDTFQARRDTLQSRKDQIDEDEKDAQRSALYQAEDRRSQALREQVRNTLKKEGVSDFLINLKLNDIDLKEGIARIKRDLAETIKELEKAGRLTPEVKKALEDAANVEIGNLPHKFKDLNSTLEEMKQNQFQEFFAGLDGSFKGFFQNVITGTKSIGDSFKELFSNILSRLAQLAIDRIFTDLFQGEGIGGLFKPKKKEGSSTGTNVGMGIAGAALQAFGIKIPGFANGGIVPSTTGGTLAVIGEGAHSEAVVPLPNGRAIPVDFRGARSSVGSMSSNTQVDVVIHNNGSTQVSGSAGGQLGKNIQQAVESVLVQHLRPNGMINRAIRSA